MDYEALKHFDSWFLEPDPKYIYYIGQSENFEEWYNSIKKNDEGPIYQDFKEKSIFAMYSTLLKLIMINFQFGNMNDIQ